MCRHSIKMWTDALRNCIQFAADFCEAFVRPRKLRVHEITRFRKEVLKSGPCWVSHSRHGAHDILKKETPSEINKW